MRKTITIICLLAVHFAIADETIKKDSLNAISKISETNVISIEMNDSITCEKFFSDTTNSENLTSDLNLHSSKEIHLKKDQHKKSKLITIKDRKKYLNLLNRMRANWLSDAWDWCGDVLQDIYDFVTFKNNFGHYREPGKNDNGPYTLFDLTTDKSKSQQLEDVRNWIKTDASAKAIYYEIYDFANKTNTGNCTEAVGVCPNSRIAKCAAFVFITGLKAVTDPTTHIITISDLAMWERTPYRDKAIDILKNVEAPSLSTGWSSFWDHVTGWIPGVNEVLNFGDGWAEFNNMQYRSKEMIMLLEAFDMLKWCKHLDGSLDIDDAAVNDAAQQLKSSYAIPMHKRVKWTNYYANNNYTLMPAAAMGLAAVCLNSYGSWALFYNEHPKEWAHPAHYNIQNTMWSCWSPMSKTGGKYGYAEGTHYFRYGFENCLVFFRAFKNFMPHDYTNSYASGVFGPFWHDVKNYNYDGDYDNVYQWYNNLLQPDGYAPPFDDSYINTGFNGVLALRGLHDGKQYNFVTGTAQMGLEGPTGLDLRPDYLAALLPPPAITPKLPSLTNMESGNIIFRSNYITPNVNHYMHILAENDPIAPNRLYLFGTHEHCDAGSFTIGAQNLNGASKKFEMLAIDPPIRHSDVNFFVNKGYHHNTISIEHPLGFGLTDDGPDYDTKVSVIEAPYESKTGDYATTKIEYTFWDNQVQRQFEVIRRPGPNGYYYFITDVVANLNSEVNSFTLNINGNGLTSESSFTTMDGNKRAKWTYPCGKGRDWGLFAEITSDNSAVTFDSYDEDEHGNTSDNYIDDTHYLDGKKMGTHSRLRAKAENFTTGVRFTTKLTPFKCNEETLLKKTVLQITSRYSSQLVQNVGYDSFNTFHYSRNFADYPGNDTIINPFQLVGTAPVLQTNAHSGFFTLGKDSIIKNGYCDPTYTYFRDMSMIQGTNFSYNDSIYISSNNTINTYYKIVTSYKYSGYVNATSGAVVTFYMPDLDQYIPMAAYSDATGALTYTHNDTTNWKYITVTFPSGTTNYSIRPANMCNFDCYFPPTVHPIDSTFNSNDGDYHTLGHKLSVIQNKGLLYISNGTRIDMCDGVYLRNQDSLLIDGPCQEKYKGFDPCSGIAGLYSTDPSSAIIVSAGSALVLDSGSYTYLKAGGAIWVKQNGSLVIKNNAFVQIGDSPNFCGFGEIITEPGAYLYIEPNAHIEFAKIAGDTVDRNLFYSKGAITGIYPFISNTLISDTILNALNYPVAICALDTINPVKHREWGYCDFMHPLAKYLVRSDTICPGEAMCIYLNRILNSASTSIYVCRKTDIHKDSFAIADLPLRNPQTYHYRITDTIAPHYFHYLDTCIQDTFWRDSVIRYGDDSCLKLHTIPDHMCFYFKPNTLHRITINTINDCGVKDDTIGYVFVADTPKFSIWVPDSVCPGSIITVNVTDINHKPGTYTFGISEIPDSLMFTDIITNLADSVLLGHYYETHSGYLPDSFTFSNFRLKGNRTYVVSLALTNDCSSASTYHLTKTTFGAKINISLASTYNNPVGPAAFQLHGVSSGATSFSWSPTTYLTNPTTLDPVSTPPDSIQYVFTASNGKCTDRDTAYVRHNELAYAGIDTEVCYNQNVLLGTEYTAAAFLGLVMHSADHGNYDAVYSNIQTMDANFAKYFMHFFLLHITDYISPAIDGLKNNKDLRDGIFKDAGFITFYNNFISSNGDPNSFNDFENMLNNNSTLKNLVENTYNYHPGSNFYDFMTAQNMFNDYFNWLNMNDTFSVKWERLDGTTWTHLSSSDHYFNMVPDNTSDKYYRITVVNNISNTVEYDQVMVKRDSIVSPQFEIAYRYDSTVIFHDVSTPEQHLYRYSWNFGDGGYSTIKNPYHTFAHSDTTFIVCMTIRDSCGTYTKCDTLKIDSNYTMQLYGKNGQIRSAKQNDQTTKPQTPNDNYLSVNKPNPFSDYSIAEYVLTDGIHNAEIRITSTIGSLIKTYKLTQNKGIIIIDGSQLRDGMYYYSLIVDGAVVASKVMVIQK
ncbi:MAG: PKD domain-containing protein [Bacteroidota bacterium]